MAKQITILFFKYSMDTVTQVHEWLLDNVSDYKWDTEFIFETSIIDAKLAVTLEDENAALMMRLALSDIFVGTK